VEVILKLEKDIINKFLVEGNFIEAQPFGSGKINDTYLIKYKIDQKEKKYILRKINRYVFKEPKLMVENTVNVTQHIRKKINLVANPNPTDKVLTLINSKNKKFYHLDENDDYWCMIEYIEDAYTIDIVETETQAFEAAKAFGRFQKYLADFNVLNCHITIKNFHNLPNRINVLKKAINQDILKRTHSIEDLLKNVDNYFYLADEFENVTRLNLPTRITHNDTKINNVMLDSKTNKGICVVDLDTVMPGIVLDDFGDMVRTFTSLASEEEDYLKVEMRLPIFEAITKGYLSEMNECLTDNEKDNLVLGAKIIVFEQTVRFLTDYLQGDVYYKTNHTNHNLDRTKNQMALLESIKKQENEMKKIVAKYS